MPSEKRTGRTYNQNHVTRPYTPGKRRFSIYWTWSYPWEANRDTDRAGQSLLDDDRGPPGRLAELRGHRVGQDELPPGHRRHAGAVPPLHPELPADRRRERPGQPVAVYQRIDQAGYRLPIDERILADTDTLMVFGLDHLVSEQEAEQEEIEAIRNWLEREGTCLLLAPHHDVGFTDDMKQRQMEYKHHGDELVPRQQRFGQYTRSLMKGLGVPVLNQFGLRPARSSGHQTRSRRSPSTRTSTRWVC